MSINHYSSEIPEALWWQQEQSHHHHHMMEPSRNNNIHNSTNSAAASFWSHHLPPAYIRNSANFSFDLNNEDDEETDEQQLTDERENTSSSNNNNIVRENEESAEVHLNREIEIMPKLSLFEKPLTPSDVGKLNRLVIPKQYAEKYFPLNNGGNNESGEKGLLLSFVDELGKPWRFRYSYWNSSQSYVLTKGWSRFVKEKKLDAGDIVLFERHPIDGDRLFIGWRRRSAAAEVSENSGVGHAAAVAGGSGGGGWTRLFFPGHPYPVQTQQGLGHANPYQPDCLHAASVLQNQTPPPSSVNANSKRFRLFGVNMDLGCQPDDSETPTPTPEDGSSLSSHGQAHYHQYQYHSDPKLYSYNHQNQMDINLSRDVTQTRYHQG